MDLRPRALTLVPGRTTRDELLQKACADSIGGFSSYSCLLYLVSALESINTYASTHYEDQNITDRITREVARLRMGMETINYGDKYGYCMTRIPNIYIGRYIELYQATALGFLGKTFKGIIVHGRLNEELVEYLWSRISLDVVKTTPYYERVQVAEFCVVHEMLFQMGVE